MGCDVCLTIPCVCAARPRAVTREKLAWLEAQCERRAKGSEGDCAFGIADEWRTVAKWLRGLQ